VLAVEDFLLKRKGRVSLVLGMGGGGDTVTAAILRRVLSLFGVKAVIGGVVWERFPIDPVPGPIRLEELNPVKPLGLGVAWVNGGTVAFRGGRIVKPQLTCVSSFLREEVLALDLWLSPLKLVEGLASVMEDLNADLVVGVDVGGDVLALGDEEDLWSPLSDQVMLAVIAELGRRGYEAVLAVHGLGVDGELEPGYLLKRISQIASLGGYMGARGLNGDDVKLLEELVKLADTESSAIPLEAFKGRYGRVQVRLGTRSVELSPLSVLTFFLDPLKVFEGSPMAKAVLTAKDLEEANKALNALGVYTEFDLERDMYEAYVKGLELTRSLILSFRREGRARLRKASGLSQ